LKKWVRGYNIATDQKFELLDEIDNLLFGATTSATNTFINILKDKINEESHLNERLINTSPGIIFIFDLERQKEVYINGNVSEIMGYLPEEILKTEENLLETLTHPDDLNHVVKNIEETLADGNGKTHQLEYRFKHKNGQYKWIRCYYTIFKRDVEGKPLQLLGTSFEMSSEKETALALTKRESQLLEAQSIALLGSFDWDMVNNTSVNTPELGKIFGFDGHQAEGEFMENVHPHDKQKVQLAMTQSFITGNYDCQYRYITKEKEKFLWARGVVLFENGIPVHMRGTVQDITQLKKIEEELVRKTSELERSNESLRQFASIASHDLKEPLRKMSMYSDMVMTLEAGNISESSHLNLGKVKASSIRMQNMIEDILNFSSITNEAEKARISLQKIVRNAMEILEESINEKGAEIIFDDLPEVNVIGVEAAGNGFAERYLLLKINDNGIGFKQDHSQKIFDLFTRLHPRNLYEGTGLGLSICKRIVENHEGTITAESEPGKGATFKILIPDKDR